MNLQTNISKAILILAIPAVSNFMLSCDKNNDAGTPASLISYGDTTNIGNGKAQSFIERNPAGQPLSAGFTMSEEALNGLPATDTVYTIHMPTDNNLLIKHISINLSSKGHPPLHIYGAPHFDVHFYMISEEEQDAIAIDTKMEVLPPSDYIPKDYAPGPGEPKMGKHWADTTSHEYHGADFDQTFIYGSYDGKFIFLEPMISLAYLRTQPNLDVSVKQAARVASTGYYPKKYAIRYDKEKKNYTIFLAELTLISR
jgi:Domain of unknown function (DUF5602)